MITAMSEPTKIPMSQNGPNLRTGGRTDAFTTNGTDWIAVLDGKIIPATFNSKGAAEAGIDVERKRRAFGHQRRRPRTLTMSKKKPAPKRKPKKEPKRPGRPTLLTPELQKQLFDLRAAGNHVKTCCQAIGLSEDAYYKWIDQGKTDRTEKKDTRYSEFVESQARAHGLHKASLLQMIATKGQGEKGDWRALAWILERTNPDEFAPKDRLDVKHQGAVQHDHTHKQILVVMPPAIAAPRPIRQIEAHTEPPKDPTP